MGKVQQIAPDDQGDGVKPVLKSVWLILWRERRGTKWRVYNLPPVLSRTVAEGNVVILKNNPLNATKAIYKAAEFREAKP